MGARTPKVAGLRLAEVSSKFCGNPMGPYPSPTAKLSGQQLLCNCHSACCEDRAFQDDGEAVIWFEPLDRRE
jgi:hypothetical protein